MSEDSTGAPSAPSAEGAEKSGQVLLERLYLKDASFESPRSPEVFRDRWQPEFQLEINTRSSGLGEDRFEVVLSATLRAQTGGVRDPAGGPEGGPEGGNDAAGAKTAYIVEIQHAGVFHVSGLADTARQRVLGTLCPGTLFPYVRETVDSLVVKGGFPAVHLAPVNFEAIYADALRKQADAAAGPATPAH